MSEPVAADKYISALASSPSSAVRESAFNSTYLRQVVHWVDGITALYIDSIFPRFLIHCVILFIALKWFSQEFCTIRQGRRIYLYSRKLALSIKFVTLRSDAGTYNDQFFFWIQTTTSLDNTFFSLKLPRAILSYLCQWCFCALTSFNN